MSSLGHIFQTVWKNLLEKKRGNGIRRKVSDQAKLPGNWLGFLRDPEDKKELFSFLTGKVAQFRHLEGTSLNITSDESVLSWGSSFQMGKCNHEEANTWIVVHILHARKQGSKSVLVRTVDTDVIVILVGQFHYFTRTQPWVDVWVAFGMGRNYRYYGINSISANLGPEKSVALSVFHAISGCDTTSAFWGKGKKRQCSRRGTHIKM